jgi:hypothetical protein
MKTYSLRRQQLKLFTHPYFLNYFITYIFKNINDNSATKNNKKGSNTKNQATYVAPDLHIIFKTHVQNNMYKIDVKIMIVLFP